MNYSDFVIKKATIEDAETIYNFIYQLAEYEKLTEEVTTNAEELKKILFAENTHVHTIIAFYKNKPVGFALYFYNFSTFKGKTGLYLEDLFVLPEMRGKGFGRIRCGQIRRSCHSVSKSLREPRSPKKAKSTRRSSCSSTRKHSCRSWSAGTRCTW